MTLNIVLANIIAMKNILDTKTALDIILEISTDMRILRRKMKISQSRLSSLSGVSLGSIKRFEQTGEISLHSFARIAVVLNCDESLIKVFKKEYYSSIMDIINEK